MSRELRLYEYYTRAEVHGIFDPESNFTPQTGTWGLQGIVRIGSGSNRVFFVTFGQSQSGHDFDESISEDGVLIWQSQPKQKLNDLAIQEFINHDHTINDIHLFLRTRTGTPYLYLGRLAYVDHVADKEQPVHFLWQLLDWPIHSDLLADAGILLVPSGGDEKDVVPGLTKVDPPQKKRARGTPASTFGKTRKITVERRDEENSALGRHGEHLVIEHERKALIAAGREDLASEIVHVALTEGDGAGYDIRSFFPGGAPKHIEVKTTRGGKGTDFYISPGELDFAKANSESYRLVRVFSASDSSDRASYFEMNTAELFSLYEFVPAQFRVKLLREESDL